MSSSHEQFLGEIEAFLRDRKMDATAFGRGALNDPGFIFDLRTGRSPSLKTIDRVRAFMNAAAGAPTATPDKPTAQAESAA